MFRFKRALWMTLALSTALALSAGCSVYPPGTDAPTVEAENLPTIAPASTAELPTQGVPEVAQASPEQPETAPGFPPRPAAPAGVSEDFREDSPLQVGATGKPQLIEFFAYW